MKISPQPSAVPARPLEQATKAEAPAKAVAAPAAEPLLQAQPKSADLFGGAARQVSSAQASEVAFAAAVDPLSQEGVSRNERFFNGMGPAVHVVKAGDTLNGIIAANYPEGHMTAEWLATHNGIENPNLIKVGQEIVLAELFSYTVQKGDTLSSIADITFVSVDEIATANGIENPDLIKVGQELRLSGPWGGAFDALSSRIWDTAQPEQVTVKPGDTLFKIARETFPEAAGDQVALQEVVDAYVNWNQIENPNLIKVGQELQVPGRYAYTVQPGDTMWSVATGFGAPAHSIAEQNGLDPKAALEPGQVLELHGAIWGC